MKSPVTVVLIPCVTVPEIDKFGNVVLELPPIVVVVVNETIPVPATVPPFLVQLPVIVRVIPPFKVRVPLVRVSEAQLAATVVVTLNPPSIIAISPATGKLAPLAPPDEVDQVAVLFQLFEATEYLVKARLENDKNKSPIRSEKVIFFIKHLAVMFVVPFVFINPG